MSSEVVDSNPYSRLMALKRMGIVDNYEEIRSFTVAVVVSKYFKESDHLVCKFLGEYRELVALVVWPRRC